MCVPLSKLVCEDCTWKVYPSQLKGKGREKWVRGRETTGQRNKKTRMESAEKQKVDCQNTKLVSNKGLRAIHNQNLEFVAILK